MNKEEIIQTIKMLINMVSTPNDYTPEYIIKLANTLNHAKLVLHRLETYSED